MQRCSVCNGRTLQVEEGYKCMSSACAGSKMKEEVEGVICRCGEQMSAQGEDSWGQPIFVCIYCGALKRM